MAAIDMNGLLRDWVAKAITDACMGEDFGYDVRWDLKPPVLWHTIVITMSNPLLGQGPLVQQFKAPVGSLREDAIRMGVHHVMGQLRDLHKQVLAAGPKPVLNPGN